MTTFFSWIFFALWKCYKLSLMNRYFYHHRGSKVELMSHEQIDRLFNFIWNSRLISEPMLIFFWKYKISVNSEFQHSYMAKCEQWNAWFSEVLIQNNARWVFLRSFGVVLEWTRWTRGMDCWGSFWKYVGAFGTLKAFLFVWKLRSKYSMKEFKIFRFNLMKNFFLF